MRDAARDQQRRARVQQAHEDAVVAAAASGPVTAATLISQHPRIPHPSPPPLLPGAAARATLEEQLTAMHSEGAYEAAHDGDGDEDGSYLELLMQNAISNLRRDSHETHRLSGPGNM
jgi:hypothetical protein